MKRLLFHGCLLFCACAERAHMTPEFGHAYRTTLVRQTANPKAGEQGSGPNGLDTQEAAVISQSYRASLARKGQAAPQEAALLHITPSEVGKDALPPASVPPESH